MFSSIGRFQYLSLSVLTAACLLATSLDVQAFGKKGKKAKGPPPGAEILTVRGTVREFTTAPKGEKDGVILTDGTWVHWPPHLEDRFSGVVGKGDKVKVIGWLATDKRGATKLEVSSLTNLDTNQTRENDRFPPNVIEGRGRLDARFGEAVTADGTVREFTTAPRGEVDGFILSDGRWVHWPPHLANRFADFVVKGDRVRVTGFMRTSKKGEARLEVSTLTNQRTNKTIENPDQPLPLADRSISSQGRDREARIRELEVQVQQIMREIRKLREER